MARAIACTSPCRDPSLFPSLPSTSLLRWRRWTRRPAVIKSRSEEIVPPFGVCRPAQLRLPGRRGRSPYSATLTSAYVPTAGAVGSWSSTSRLRILRSHDHEVVRGTPRHGGRPPLNPRRAVLRPGSRPGRLPATRQRLPSACLRSRVRTRAERAWRCERAAEGLTAADVDRALTEERSLLITWLNRGTLHLVRSEDYPLLQLADHPAAPHLLRAAPAPGGRAGRAGRARRRDDRAGAGRRGTADTAAAARASRLGRCADRGPGADPPPLSRRRARARRARADGRQRPRLRPRPRLARRNSAKSIATWLSPSSPVATSSATRPPTIATSPAGPACRCATRAPASRRSLQSWSSATTASSISPRRRRSPRSPARACSAPSIRCCSAGPRVSASSARTPTW